MATFGFEYRKKNSGIVLEKYLGSDSIVDVPPKISGLPVVEMEAGTFGECTNLRKIFLPDSLKSIDERTFFGCASLTEIHWRDTLIKIGGHEFKISAGTPTEINLPRFLIHLGGSAEDTANLPTVDDFDDTDSEITDTEKILSLTTDDFDDTDYETTGAEKISSPTTDDFDDNASETTAAEKFRTTPAEYFKYSKNNWGIVIEKYIGEDPIVVIPNEIEDLPVLVIGNGAFQNRKALKAVHLPETLQTINDWAFGYCSGLTEIRLPDELKYIGGAAFWYCTGLTEVHFPAYLQVIGWWAFEGCANLTDVYFPVALQKIGAKAFATCMSLENFHVPRNLPESVKNQIREVLPEGCGINYV